MGECRKRAKRQVAEDLIQQLAGLSVCGPAHRRRIAERKARGHVILGSVRVRCVSRRVVLDVGEIPQVRPLFDFQLLNDRVVLAQREQRLAKVFSPRNRLQVLDDLVAFLELTRERKKTTRSK